MQFPLARVNPRESGVRRISNTMSTKYSCHTAEIRQIHESWELGFMHINRFIKNSIIVKDRISHKMHVAIFNIIIHAVNVCVHKFLLY
jgi:hypothetical protein